MRGGYARILGRMEEKLKALGAVVRTSTPVLSIEPAGAGVRVVRRDAGGDASAEYDQVYFTAPTRLARRVAAPAFLPHVEAVEKENPTSTAYLGVACLVLALEKPLTPYYVLNIGETSIELTGLIEMTNLIDPKAETGGRSLIYLPRYMDSESAEFEQSDAALRDGMIDRGLKRLFPDFDAAKASYCGIHRARYVQPLPLVRQGKSTLHDGKATGSNLPFRIVNTSMLRCATLNNNEVIALVDRILGHRQEGRP